MDANELPDHSRYSATCSRLVVRVANESGDVYSLGIKVSLAKPYLLLFFLSSLPSTSTEIHSLSSLYILQIHKMKLISGVALLAAASTFSAVTAAPAVEPALAVRAESGLEERTLWGLGGGWCVSVLGLFK